MKAHIIALALLVATGSLPASVARDDESSSSNISGTPTDDWRTHAERSAYEETGRYDEAVAFCRRLADASPDAHLDSFGTSGEGRTLPLLILSREHAFTPQAARDSEKLLVLLQNCIHPGECAGKDASLELARDILITRTREALLEHVNLLIMPIFNTDGHERFSPYSRINQNGPREMGWRVTATNLNLNRDYTKADAVEMQAWLHAWTNWQPDLLFDNHTTNGSDHQYTLLYSATTGQLIAQPIADWMKQSLIPNILPPLEAAGHNPFPYGGPRDRADISKGINTFSAHSPRFSTGYSAICNRPSFLVETHALKTYEQRVRATYAIMWYTLEELNRQPDALRTAIREADQQAIATRGGDGPSGEVVLQLADSDESVPVTYKAVEFTVRKSDITGADVIEYSSRPMNVETRLYHGSRIAKTVAPPAAYLVPPQWKNAIDRFELHGVEFFRLKQQERIEVESYRFEDVTFAPHPYEGRFAPRYTTIPTRETRDYVAGTVVVPLDQKRAKVAVHLLEPEAPDCLLAWGLMNTIFEQKEYAESYVMEPIAQRMLAENPELKREFEEKLRSDEQFAGDPRARLGFFYRRSPYWDQTLNVYPIARLMDDAVLTRLRARNP